MRASSGTGREPPWLKRLNVITDELRDRVGSLEFSPPVTHVYNPLAYAREPYDEYLRRFAEPPKDAVLVGMNPGPFGMAQSGIPFGDVAMVRDWMGISGHVQKPANEHPKRPVAGFECHRREVSGSRLWGWAKDTFGDPVSFFGRFFVANYCPLVFMEESGRNRTPDKLPSEERGPLFDACDEALGGTIEVLRPKAVVAIGRFAERRARVVLESTDLPIGRILHPSPANPQANRDWEGSVRESLHNLGIELP